MHTPPEPLQAGIGYLVNAFNELREFVLKTRVVPARGFMETDAGLMPPAIIIPDTIYPPFYMEWDYIDDDGVWVYPGNLYEITDRGVAATRHIPDVAAASLTVRRKLTMSVSSAQTVYLNWDLESDDTVTSSSADVSTSSSGNQSFTLATVNTDKSVSHSHLGNVWTSTIPYDEETTSGP